MARISVPHTVPVQVIVDTETGTVERVVVIDEEVNLDPDGYWEDQGSSVGTVSTADRRVALAIVQDTEIMWPVWDMGW